MISGVLINCQMYRLTIRTTGETVAEVLLKLMQERLQLGEQGLS